MNEELTLVSRVLSGDAEAWSTFCTVYSPVIEKSIRRYVRDAETARDIYVSLLEGLKHGKLKSFEGRSTLAAWLFWVVRNHCRDYYRSASGVRHLMSMLKDLRPNERRFFELYYIQGLPLHEAYESMRTESKGDISCVTVYECIEAVRRKVAKKRLARLTERLLRPDARRYGARALSSERGEQEVADSDAPSPEDAADSELLEGALIMLREALLELPYGDRLIVQLRFEHRLSARKIGEILDLGSEKRVRKKLDRLLGELRSTLIARGLSEHVARELVEDMG